MNVYLKTPGEIEKLRTVNLIVSEVLDRLQENCKPGVSTWELNELADKTLGVLGLGRIGQLVARRALGLGMRVVAYDPFVAKERFRELGVDHAETQDDVLAAADFLTLHLPLTAETRGSIGADRGGSSPRLA